MRVTFAWLYRWYRFKGRGRWQAFRLARKHRHAEFSSVVIQHCKQEMEGRAMKIILIALALTLSAASVRAQEPMPTWVSAGIVAANVADGVTYARAAQRNRTVFEANPILPSNPTANLITKSAFGVGLVVLTNYLATHGHKTEARVTALFWIAVPTCAAWHNASVR